MPNAPKRAAIVGAGITGLTTAFQLAREPGWKPTVFEATETVGGPIQSRRVGDYLLESGPHTILERTRATTRLIEALDLVEARVEANPDAANRYVVRHGELRPAPMSIRDFVATDLLSQRAKLRLLAEPLIPARDDDIDESLASFVERRLGPEVLDYAVGPMVGGVYAGRPRHLSARHAFDGLHDMEQKYGSLAQGLVRRLLTSAGSADEETPRRLISFREGSHQLVETLARRLDERLQLDHRVTSLHRDPRSGWRLDFEDQPETDPFDAVVWTAPGYELSQLELSSRRGRADLDVFDEIYYPPVAVVALGYESYRVGHPLDGFGCLVPEPEPYRILGALFMSSLFPSRAPSGRELLSCFVGGSRQPELARESDETLLQLVQTDLRELLGVRGAPEMTEITRWERAIPQYEVGYGRIRERFEELEGRFHGLHFTGSFRDGIAVPDLIEAGTSVARRLANRNGDSAPRRRGSR